MLGRIAIDWVTGRSLDEMELLVVRLNVQSGHHKLSEVAPDAYDCEWCPR